MAPSGVGQSPSIVGAVGGVKGRGMDPRWRSVRIYLAVFRSASFDTGGEVLHNHRPGGLVESWFVGLIPRVARATSSYGTRTNRFEGWATGLAYRKQHGSITQENR